MNWMVSVLNREDLILLLLYEYVLRVFCCAAGIDGAATVSIFTSRLSPWNKYSVSVYEYVRIYYNA